MTEKIQSILNDEESMQQIKELAAMLGVSSDETASSAPSAAGFPDPAAFMQLSAAFGSNDKYCCLLSALKPLLSEERQLKAEQAIRILKLYNAYTVLKDSGMIDKLGLL